MLLKTLADGSALESVPGLCWREDGVQRVNRPAPLVAPARMAQPDFDDWFEVFEASPISEHVEPELVLESARGCWWGEHHHCTFCGLNGTGMTFRAKPAPVFVAEVDDLVTRHKVMDIMVVDNILEPAYLRTALPDLASRDWDLRLHYEVKANLTTQQVGVLGAAGAYSVQPGIESLVDDVLKRMDKGIKAVHNVRTMRDLESAGLTVAWNWLYGFPGERLADYADVVAQLPALVHLQPPDSTARIELNRFSPYFENAALGFPVREPAEPYGYVYDLTPDQLADMVYLFATPQAGLTEDEVGPLNAAVAAWIRDYPASSLRRIDADDVVVLRDRRVGWPQEDHILSLPREKQAWAELEHGRSLRGLASRLDWDPSEWLASLRERGLVFHEGGRWVALATSFIR